MKTHILRLEPHDDVISIRDKMTWGKTSRILLVWPQHDGPILQRIELVLIKRQAKRLGSQLALVTQNQFIQDIAGELFIPVFTNPKKAQQSRWRFPRHIRRKIKKFRLRPSRSRQQIEALRPSSQEKPGGQYLPAVRLIAFTMGVMAVLSLAAILLPTAQVNIYPMVRNEGLPIDIQASPDFQTVNLTGTLPVHLQNVTVEGRASIPSSGHAWAPSKPAVGQVRFTNLTDQPVKIPAGTIVLTTAPPVIRFITTQAGTLSAGAGHAIFLPIQAIDLGKSGNLPADRIQAIEGALGLSAAVNNPRPTSGGSDVLVAAPTSLDRDQLYNQLLQSLQQTALEEVHSLIDSEDWVLENSLTQLNILKNSVSPSEGQPAEQIELTLRIEFQVWVISGADLRTLSQNVLQTRLSEGYQLEAESVSWHMLSAPQFDSDGIAHWRMLAQGQSSAQITPAQVLPYLLGAAPELASRKMQNTFPMAAAPAINLTPTWWPRLPVLPFRMEILVQSPPVPVY